MKKFIILSTLLLAAPSYARELQNYDEITNALKTGKTIHVVTDFTHCSATNKAAISIKGMSVAVFTPNEIGFTDDHIATAFTHFTLNDPFFLNKPVYEFVRYTITPDNNMTVTLNILDAPTYALLMDKISFTCKINESTKVYT